MKRFVSVLILLTTLFAAFSLSAEGNDVYAETSSWFSPDPNAGQNSFLILTIPGGGKYEGMSTAYTAVTLDNSYLESNPAAGSFLPSTRLNFSHVDWISDTGVETISYSFRPEKLEDMGLGFNTKFLHVPFTGYNDWGSQYNMYGASASGWYTEIVATAAFSYNFLRNFYFGGLSVGASMKTGYRGVSAALEPGQNAVSIMGDVGLLTKFNFLKPYASREKNFAVGVSVKNLGTEFIDDPDPLPTFASVGISYKPLKPLTLAFDFNVPFNLNGEAAEKYFFAAGVNAEITSFLSAHSGFLIKQNKPRFTVGADVLLNKVILEANYTLDLTSRLEMFDRMSVSVKINLDTVKQLLIKDDVQELYLSGLSEFADGNLEKAIKYWENCLSLDPSFTPAQQMLVTAKDALNEETRLKESLNK